MRESHPKFLSLDELERYFEMSEERPDYYKAADVVVGKFASIVNLDDDEEWLAAQMDRQTGDVYAMCSYLFDHLDECAMVAKGIEWIATNQERAQKQDLPEMYRWHYLSPSNLILSIPIHLEGSFQVWDEMTAYVDLQHQKYGRVPRARSADPLVKRFMAKFMPDAEVKALLKTWKPLPPVPCQAWNLIASR